MSGKDGEAKMAEGELKEFYCIASAGKQADQYTKTTKAIAEYVGRVYGHEMKILVLQGKETVIQEPEYPTGSTVTEKDKAIWSKRYDLYLKKEDRYNDYKAKVFTLVLSGCDKPMRNRVESASGYLSVEGSNDVAGLLQIIKDIAFDSNEKKYPPMQAAVAWRNLAKVWQQDGEDLVDYYKRFVSLVEIVERSYGIVAPEEIAKNNSKYNKDKQSALDIERDRMLAFMFMDGADKRLFGFLLKKLADDFALGDGKYPENAEEALQVLTLHMERPKSKGKKDDEPIHLSFAQGRKSKCWKCGKEGHLKKDCPELQEAAETSAAQVIDWRG